MNNQARIAAVIILIVLVGMQILADPISSAKHSMEINHIQNMFAEAQHNWAAANISGYRFEIHGSSQGLCAVNAVIEVKANTVTEVKPLDAAAPLPPDAWPDPDWGNEVFLCAYNHFTIPQMFAMLEKALKNSPFTILEAEFDPQYGFMTRFKDGRFASQGWLNLRGRKVYNEFQISNFKMEQ